MDEMDYWRLVPHYTIVEVSALIIGLLPECIVPANSDDSLHRDFLAILDCIEDERFQPIYTAVVRSILSNDLECAKAAHLIAEISKEQGWPRGYVSDGTFHKTAAYSKKIPREICFDAAFITFDEVKKWLGSKGITTGFFFPHLAVESTPSYLNKNNLCFPPKLYAAVRAWEAVSSNQPLLNKPGSAKQKIINWLEINAEELGLTDESGKLVVSTIENIAKLANWDTTGGRSKTTENDN